jgi:hypothetical protein
MLNVTPRGHSTSDTATNVVADISPEKGTLSYKVDNVTYRLTAEKLEIKGVVND